MPLYQYKAFNTKGKLVDGILTSPSKESAYAVLKEKGLFPKSIKQDTTKVGATVNSDLLAFALTQLASLLKAGVPMTKALDSLVTQVESKALGRSFAHLKTFIEEGGSFSDGLAADSIFPPLLVKMSKAGESVGNLELILEEYAQFLEKESENVKKIVSSLIYPCVILIACTALILFIIAFTAPTLSEIFSQFNKALPISTQIMVSFGIFVRTYLFLIILIPIILIYCYNHYLSKSVKDNFKTAIPFFGKVYRDLSYSRWAATLGLLHGGGVPLLNALESAREVLGNSALERELIAVEKKVEKGLPLSSALSLFFPPLLVNMVETGQQSGDLDKMMQSAAQFYEKEADRKLSLFTKLFEPVMILILGGVVGFVVISILLPIFEINTIIR